MSASSTSNQDEELPPARKANASLVENERQLRQGLQNGHPGLNATDNGSAIRMEHLLADPNQAERLAKEIS